MSMKKISQENFEALEFHINKLQLTIDMLLKITEKHHELSMLSLGSKSKLELFDESRDVISKSKELSNGSMLFINCIINNTKING